MVYKNFFKDCYRKNRLGPSFLAVWCLLYCMCRIILWFELKFLYQLKKVWLQILILIPVNGKEKPNSMKKNSVSFVEISNSPLCKVLPIVLAPVTVGILVIDMTRKLKETMDSGSNTTGFSKLTYRGMRQIWKVFSMNVIGWIIICEDIVFNRLYRILASHIPKCLYIKSEHHSCWNTRRWIFRDGMWLWSKCGLRNFKWIVILIGKVFQAL